MMPVTLLHTPVFDPPICAYSQFHQQNTRHAMKSPRLFRILALLPALLAPTAMAEYPLKIQQVTDNVYALVGELAQRSPENLANNSTHGVIITDAGVILVDPGGSYRGAEQIAAAIKTITDQPVKVVINSGGQDHRWLGNGYFKERGARIIASNAAIEDHHARTDRHLETLDNLIGEALTGTEPTYAEESFEDQMELSFGGVDLELYYRGPAHTPGDIFIWLPAQKVMFTGDIVYVERMLGIGPARNVESWIEVFESMASFEPLHIIPGHGSATDLATASRDTRDYLVFLYDNISRLLDEGADMMEAAALDQSRFSYLEVSEQIAGRNAQNLYEQLEFESF